MKGCTIYTSRCTFSTLLRILYSPQAWPTHDVFSRPVSLEDSECPSSVGILAVKLIPENKIAIKHSNLIWENRDKLPKAVLQCMIRESKDADNFYDPLDSDNDGREAEGQATSGLIEYTALLLGLGNIQDLRAHLGWPIGKGSSKDADCIRGINIFIACAGDGFDGLGAALAAIFIHPRSGILMIQCTSALLPIFLFEDGEWTPLPEKDMRAIHQKITPLRLGKSEFKMELPALNDLQYTEYMRGRNLALAKKQHKIPNSRLYGLPRNGCFPLIGRVSIHNSMNDKGLGWNQIGVDVTNGEVRMVQEVRVGEDRSRAEIMQEAYFLLAFDVSFEIVAKRRTGQLTLTICKGKERNSSSHRDPL